MHLKVTPESSVEFVALWLSRTGSTLPLEITVDIRASESPDYSEWRVENPWWENPTELSRDEITWHILADTVPGSIPAEWRLQWPGYYERNPNVQRSVKDMERGNQSWGCAAMLLLIAEMRRWRRFEVNIQCNWSGIEILKDIGGT